MKCGSNTNDDSNDEWMVLGMGMDGRGRSILAKNATATNYVNYAFGWRMRLHKFYSCQHSRQHDRHTGYRAVVGRGGESCVEFATYLV